MKKKQASEISDTSSDNNNKKTLIKPASTTRSIKARRVKSKRTKVSKAAETETVHAARNTKNNELK